MRQLLSSICIAGLMVFGSCSTNKPTTTLDRVYAEETSSQDLQAITASGELTPEEMMTLKSYLLNGHIPSLGITLPGRTYRELMESAKHYTPPPVPDSLPTAPPLN